MVALLLGASASPRAEELNGFLPEAGSTDIALSVTFESYDHFWRGGSRVSTPPELGQVDTRTFSLWARHGVRPDLAVIFNVPHVDVSTDGSAGFSADGLQDISALVDYRFARSAEGRHSGLVLGGIRTPLRDYEANAPVSVGDGTTDFLLSFLYHYQQRATYLSQQVGFELRGGEVPNGLSLYTELGHSWGRWTLSAFNSAYWALSGTDIGDDGFTFPSNQENRWRIGAKIYGQLKDHFGVGLSYFTSLDGRNTGDTTGFSLGTAFRF